MRSTIFAVVFFTVVFAPASFACKLMLVGDQTTAGFGPQPSPFYGTVGWRLPLQMAMSDAGLSCDFVGSKSEGFDNNPNDTLTFDPDWEGADLFTAEALSASVSSIIATYHPDIAVVTVGTHDVLVQNQLPAQAAGEVVAALDLMHATDPDLKIIYMIWGTGNPRDAGLESLRTNLLPLLAAREYVSVVDLRLVLVPSTDYISLILLNAGGNRKVTEALFPVLQPIALEVITSSVTQVPIPSSAFGLLATALCVLALRRRAS